MAIKPFEIQSSTLTIGGVDLQAGNTSVVIPGVTQATSYKVEEVEDTGDQTQTLNPATAVVVDFITYDQISAGLNPNFTADYTVELDEEGYIDKIQVNGRGTYNSYLSGLNESNDMYAYIGSGSANDRPIVPQDWTQIPFRPKMRAGEIENVGGGGIDKIYSIAGAYTIVAVNTGDNVVYIAGDHAGTLNNCDYINVTVAPPQVAYAALDISYNNITDQTAITFDSDLEVQSFFATQETKVAAINLMNNPTGLFVPSGFELNGTFAFGAGDRISSLNFPWSSFTVNDDGTVTFPDGTKQSTAYGSYARRSYLLHEDANPNGFTTPQTITIDGIDYAGGEVQQDNAFGAVSSRVTLYADSMFAMIAVNTDVNTVYYNGETGADGDGTKTVASGLENYRDGYYSWYNKFSGTGDPAITQIVIAKNPANPGNVSYYNRSTDTNNDDFTVSGLAGATTVIVFNVYWDADGGPAYESSIETATKAIIDAAIYDGGPTELTDLTAIKAAFYARSADMKSAIEGWEGDLLFALFEFFSDTFQAVKPTTTISNGSGAVLEIRVRPDGEGGFYYDNEDVILPGTGYQIGDTLTVPGTEFGGTSPANDVTITVDSVSFPNGGIVDHSVSGTAPSQVWPQSYIRDGNADIFDIGNFIGTDHTRVTAVATLTYTGGGTTGNAVFQTLNIISADKAISPGQWAWFESSGRGALINWALSYGDNNEAAYLDEYTGYNSTAALNYDYQVDVDNAHLTIRGDGRWDIGSSNFDTKIFSIAEIDPDPLDIIVRANNNDWMFDRNGNLTLPTGGDILDSNGDSVLAGGGGNLIGTGSAAGVGFTRTVYTDYFNGQGGEADGNGNQDWFWATDVTGVEAGDTITFRQGEVRTISNVTVNGLYTAIDWSGDAVTGSDTLPRYPVTITSSDYSAPEKNKARIKPDLTAANDWGHYMDIYAGGGSPVIDSKHIHMSGHTGEIELFLGTDSNYVSAKEAGTAPAGVRLHSENDVSVESSNLRINRKGSTWAAVYGDGNNVNSDGNTNDLTFDCIAVDEHGDYYVGGEHCQRADAIISKYGRDGNLIWSNYSEGAVITGFEPQAIAYHNGEVASAVKTNNGRTTSYLKLVVQNSTTGEVKSTTDIYDTDNTVRATSMIYHSTLGWVVVGKTWGETLVSSTITATGNTGVGIIELPSAQTKLENIYPETNGDWYMTGTSITGDQYLTSGLGMYRDVPITTVTGGGAGGVARVTVSYNGGGTYSDLTVTTQGSGYNSNDELKIPGSLLGGVDGGSSVTATPFSVNPASGRIMVQFSKIDYPSLYDQLNWASYNVSYNAHPPADVVSIVDSQDGYWNVVIDNSDINISVATFYTASGNDLTFLAQVSGDALVGPNSVLTGVASRKTIRLDMGFAMGYGSVDFTGGTFTISRHLNTRPWVWTSGWTRYLDPAVNYGSGTAYTVAEVPAGGLLVGGYIDGTPTNHSFIWKLNTNGSTGWLKGILADGQGVRSLAVSTVDGSIYATTTYNQGTLNKLDYTGALQSRIAATGMWGLNPHVKLEIDLDGNEQVYVGGSGGAIWIGPYGAFMLNKFTSNLQPVWGRSMHYNGGESINIEYSGDPYDNFVLGKGQATLVGYSNLFSVSNTNAVMFTMDTTDEFTPVNNVWEIKTHADQKWELQEDWATNDLLTLGIEAKTSSASTDIEVTGLALSQWRFQERVVNLNEIPNGIVGVESITFADGNVLDHNPSDIPPSTGFDSQTGWNYTLQLSDRGRFIINQTVPNTSYAQHLYITVPRNDNVPFPVGTVITLINTNSISGNGYKIYVQPESYGDLNAPQIWTTGGNQNPSTWSFQGIQTATLMKISSNGWLLTANDVINED